MKIVNIVDGRGCQVLILKFYEHGKEQFDMLLLDNKVGVTKLLLLDRVKQRFRQEKLDN